MRTPADTQMLSERGLRRATLALLLTCIVIVVAVVLPAERGIDPTGLGRVLGLTEMGEFKVEAAREFADAAHR
jgi:hypothetical protein